LPSNAPFDCCSHGATYNTLTAFRGHNHSDFITGFCGETDEEHSDTLSLMKHVQYEHAFMFHYSARTKTYASRWVFPNSKSRPPCLPVLVLRRVVFPLP
jgi:hypothetical protein